MPEQTNIPEIIIKTQQEGIVTEPLLLPRYPMVMFSSSHMTEHHHFKEALQEVWTVRFSDNPCVHYPEVDARPGCKLDNQFVAEFANKLETLTEPTVLLINLGDNNLTLFWTPLCRLSISRERQDLPTTPSMAPAWVPGRAQQSPLEPPVPP